MARTRTRITLRGTGRRGIAMMMVLVAMVVTVVLTSAAIVSRETSPAMGQNATALAATAWSAESAANYAVGVLAGGFDWESAMGPDGAIVQDMTIGGATVQVTLLDMEGNVPDAEDRDLIMVAVATVNGISTTVRRAISLGEPGDPLDAIDLMMGEFAILGVDELTVASSAMIGVWSLSPESTTRPQFKAGTAFSSASFLDVRLDGAIGPVEMHVDLNGDAGLVSEVAGSGYSLQWQMPVRLPVLDKGVPSAVMAAMASTGDYEPAPAAVVTMAGAKNYDDIRIRNNAVVTIDGTTPTALRCDRLELDNGVLKIVGDVSIYVRDRVRVENSSAIALADADAQLRIYVCDEMELDSNSQVGVLLSDVGRIASSLQTWVSPDRVQILEVSTSQGGSGAPQITLQNSSTLVAAMHAPNADFQIQTGATLIGRVTASQIDIGSNGRVWYDPTLDPRMGFTNPTGPLYQDSVTMDPIIEAALDDVASSGVSTIEGFMALLEVAYEDQKALALVGGVVEETTGLVQNTVHIFTGLLGIK